MFFGCVPVIENNIKIKIKNKIKIKKKIKIKTSKRFSLIRKREGLT